MTSKWRRCDVFTSHRRHYNVILTLCFRWEGYTVGLKYCWYNAFFLFFNPNLYVIYVCCFDSLMCWKFFTRTLSCTTILRYPIFSTKYPVTPYRHTSHLYSFKNHNKAQAEEVCWSRKIDESPLTVPSWCFCPGPSCSKLTTSLVNVSLKFQTLISQICQYFLLKKCKSFSHFFNKNYQCIWL